MGRPSGQGDLRKGFLSSSRLAAAKALVVLSGGHEVLCSSCSSLYVYCLLLLTAALTLPVLSSVLCAGRMPVGHQLDRGGGCSHPPGPAER